MERISTRTRKITLMGILLAMTIVLSLLENALPTIPFLPPNSRLGLSNVIVMYTLFFLGAKYAFGMAILKSTFVAITRGVIAGFMSLSGGILSVALMVILLLIFKKKITYLLLSVFGSIGHSFGQMLAASLQMQANLVAYYWPFLLISSVLFGVITGVLLQIVIPAFNRINRLVVLEKNEKETNNQ